VNALVDVVTRAFAALRASPRARVVTTPALSSQGDAIVFRSPRHEVSPLCPPPSSCRHRAAEPRDCSVGVRRRGYAAYAPHVVDGSSVSCSGRLDRPRYGSTAQRSPPSPVDLSQRWLRRRPARLRRRGTRHSHRRRADANRRRAREVLRSTEASLLVCRAGYGRRTRGACADARCLHLPSRREARQGSVLVWDDDPRRLPKLLIADRPHRHIDVDGSAIEASPNTAPPLRSGASRPTRARP
jgi:hypothetical protein